MLQLLALALVPLAAASPVQQLAFSIPRPTRGDGVAATNSTRLVPLTLGVMSKCPDAVICETLIDRVLDTHTSSTGRQVVGDLVDLELVYLAKENRSSTSPSYGGLECLHGPSECAANVQQLCAASHWGTRRSVDTSGSDKGARTEGDVNGWSAAWWSFVQCMNYGRRDRVGEVATAKECAKVVGRSWTTDLERCATNSSSSEGAKLFRASVERSHKLDITKSCTIVLNERKICVHDGTWKECSGGHEVGDIVQQIKDEHKRINAGHSADPNVESTRASSTDARIEAVEAFSSDRGPLDDEDEAWIIV